MISSCEFEKVGERVEVSGSLEFHEGDIIRVFEGGGQLGFLVAFGS